MRTSKKLLFVITLFFILSTYESVWAQNDKFADADLKIQACIEDQDLQGVFGESFEFSKWSSELRENCTKVWNEGNEKVLIEIAKEEPKVNELVKLSKTCEVLKEVRRFLKRTKKVYDKRIEKEQESEITENMNYSESYQVSLRKIDAYWIRWQLNALKRRFE